MRIDYFIKGIIIGIGKIVPGLSGSIMMISFGLYDKAIDAVGNFFDNIGKNMLFLFNVGIGILIGIVMFSNILKYFINNYYIYTLSLFIGLIFSGFGVIYKDMLKNKRGYVLVLLSFMVMFFINNIGENSNYIISKNYLDVVVFFLSGIMEAIGTVVPGVSSTALLMIMGVYNIYLDILANIFNINNFINNIWFLIPFLMGLFIGVIILSIVIDYLFKSYKKETFSIIMGIIIASSFFLMDNLFKCYRDILDIFISVVLLIGGYYIGKKI